MHFKEVLSQNIWPIIRFMLFCPKSPCFTYCLSIFQEPEEEDDGYGVPEAAAEEKKPKRPKDMIVKRQSMNFRLRMKMSGDACTSKTLNCAPVIHYEKRKHLEMQYTFRVQSVQQKLH